MPVNIIERMAGPLRIQIHADGRARSPINIFGSDGQLLATDTVDLRSASARERLAGQIPEEHRAAAAGPLMELGAERAQEQPVEQAEERRNTVAFEDIEPWPEPVLAEALLEDITAEIRRRVVLPPAAVVAIALWVISTYTKASHVFPYLLIRSPVLGCGKSVLLTLLRHITHRHLGADGASAAALLRLVDKWQPTVTIDELDTVRGDKAEALRQMLNLGYEKGARVPRCVGENHEIQYFRADCPKAVALSKGARLDDTTESRCVPIRMERASAAELEHIVPIRADRIKDELLPLRRKLLRFAADNRTALEDAEPQIPPTLNARQADVVRPLHAIAERAGPEWAKIARDAFEELFNNADSETEWSIMLLQDMRAILEDRAPSAEAGSAVRWTDSDGQEHCAISSAALVQRLNEMDERPWPEIMRGDKPITATRVASLLKRFRIAPKSVRLGVGRGAPSMKGYLLRDLAPVFERYLTPSDTDPDWVSGNDDYERVEREALAAGL